MTQVTTLLRAGSRRLGSLLSSERPRYSDVPAPAAHSPRILLLSASVGSGHTRAAQALQSALAELLPHATIAHVDVLQMTNAPFRWAYSNGYFRAAQRAPHAVRWMYDVLDHPRGGTGKGGDVRCAFERLNFTRVSSFLRARPWDLIINTHFLPPQLVATMRRQSVINCPQVTVVTDFDVHGLWLNDPCDRYFVATEEAKATIVAHGVDADQVQATGIPIDAVFAERADRIDCLRRHGLSPNLPVVLQLAGGFGLGSIERIHQEILSIQTPLQVVVVTGKNSDAKHRVEAMGEARARHHRHVLGFTTHMDELLGAADLVISKPGGLTTSECLARGCPMMIVEPIPGQEDRNSDFLLENGCGVKVNNIGVLGHKLQSLLSAPDRLEQMRAHARCCGRPGAAAAIAQQCLSLIRRRTVVS